MLSNPYESPRCTSFRRIPSRYKLRPTLPEIAFLAALAVTSVFVHWTHRGIFNAIISVPGFGGTVSVMVSISTLLSFVGCAITLSCKRNNRLVSVAAFVVGIVSTATIAVLTCWFLMTTGHPPSGLIVFVSVVVGMVATSLILMLPSELHAKTLKSKTVPGAYNKRLPVRTGNGLMTSGRDSRLGKR